MRAAVSYLAYAPEPRQLDLVADTILAKTETRTDLSIAPKARTRTDLSTAPKSETRTDLSTAMRRLAKRREDMEISVARLLAAAGITRDTYFNALRGRANTRPSTIARLNEALNALAVGREGINERTLCQSYLRTITSDLARRTGWDPELMLGQDFSSENTNDPVWRQASRLRRCSIYLLVEGLGMGKAKIGHAIGMSRQGVHKAVADIEAARDDDAGFDTMMQAMMQQLKADK